MVYAVPLPDGTFGLAQSVDAMAVNIIYVSLFADRLTALPPSTVCPSAATVVALAATWRQELNRGDWFALGVAPVVIEKSQVPNERFAASGYVGATHDDAGILVDLLAAWHGLIPWNVMADESFYDKLLAPGVRRPPTAVLLNAAEREAYRRREFGIP